MPSHNPLRPADPVGPVRVWDLPTRLFHWLLAATVLCSMASAKIGGNAMVWHFRCGYLVLALLVFRLLWGLVGGRWSRFRSFIHGPRTVWRYLRGSVLASEHLGVGHNPVGALSVFALLAVLAVQVATGLVADDEIASVGPLNRFVSSATAGSATAWHKGYGQWVVLGLIGLHIAAIGWYLMRQVDLLGPMLSGDKDLPAGTPASADGPRQRLLALLLVALCIGGVALLMATVARGG